MNEDECIAFAAAIDCHNRMASHIRRFAAETPPGEPPIEVPAVLGMVMEVERHRQTTARLQGHMRDRNLVPADDVTTLLGSTWRALLNAALGGPVPSVPLPLHLRKAVPALLPAANG